MLLVAAFAAAIAATVTSIRLSRHVRQGISRRSLLFRGILFYRRDTFDEDADALYERFTRSSGLFFALVLAAIIGSALAAARPG